MRGRLLVLISFLFTFLVACTHASDSTESKTESKGSKVRVGLVLDKGGKDDKSFNAAAYQGAVQAEKDLGIELKYVETSDDAAYETAVRTFAERGYDLVLAVGFVGAEPVKKIAAQFPKIHFAVIDGQIDAPNVASFMFAEQEGSYLVGYLAGLMTKTKKVGFIGGMDVPLIRRCQVGYEAGVKAANPKVKVEVNYVGVTPSAWANPPRGKELALSQYDRGVDIIYHAAGASGLGVFDAAEEKKKFVIGVDSNQNGLKPGRVLTSMLKKVDLAVHQIIEQQTKNEFKGGIRSLGIKDGGIDYAVDENNEKLIAFVKAKVDAVRQKIADGEIKVPDYYETQKTK